MIGRFLCKAQDGRKAQDGPIFYKLGYKTRHDRPIYVFKKVGIRCFPRKTSDMIPSTNKEVRSQIQGKVKGRASPRKGTSFQSSGSRKLGG